MTFHAPALLLLVPALAALLLWHWHRRSRHSALIVADLDVLRAAAVADPGWRVRLRALPDALRVLALLAVVVALARPQQGLAVTLLPEEGIDVVLAFDVSSSMEQRTPDGVARIDAARRVVDDFVDSLEGDRVGLVVFQSRALALAPLTLDHEALRRTVADAGPGLLPDGTAIGLGLSEALNLLRDSPARSRIAVLLTDGQNNAGEVEPLDAAQVAKALGVRVYTIGFLATRTAGALPDGVDEVTLRRIAELTDGAYYDAATEDELAAAYQTIGELERSRVGERRFTSFREFAPWLAAAALATLVVETALRATVLRRYP